MLNKIKSRRNKKGQEEIVGFALIIIIVSVILLIFLSLSLRTSVKENVESYEVESFIQSFLQYTSECEDNLEYLPIRKLIFRCYDGELCLDGERSCNVLEDTLKDIVEESWKISSDTPVKAYELEIISEVNQILKIENGNPTSNSEGAMQDFSRGGTSFEIYFTAYY